MGDYDDAVHGLEAREYDFFPVRNSPLDGVLESLCTGKVAVSYSCIAGIQAGIAGIVLGERVGSNVIAPAPYLHLCLTVFLSGLGLVESLKVAIVLFVQSPGLLNRNPVKVHLVEDVVESLDSPLEIGSVGFLEGVTFGFEKISGFLSLLDAFFTEIDISPACEAVLFVPLAFSMSYKNNSFHDIFGNVKIFQSSKIVIFMI